MAADDDKQSTRTGARAALDAFWAAAWSAAGLVSAVAAIALIGFSYLPSGALRDALENIAAVVLAIGLLQILSAAWLQRKLTEGILEEQQRGEARMLDALGTRFDAMMAAVGVEQQLRPSGVVAVDRLRPDWAQFLSESSRIELLPTDLVSWLREEWVGILEKARHRVISVTVHLPNVKTMDPAPIATLELRTGHSVDRLITEFDEAVTTMKRDWAAGPLGNGCSLEIWTYDSPAAFGLVITEEDWALLLPPAGGPFAGGGLVALFKSGTDPSFHEWACSQTRQLGSQFFDEVKP